jgi:hypothetical protein
MSVDWKAIQEEWLLGQTISFSESEVLDRFRLVEELLGEAWLNALKVTPGFAPPILRALLIADKLSAVKDCVGIGAVLEKIKLNDASAHSELTAAFLQASRETTIEFEPAVAVKNRSRKSDFRARLKDGDWCYVEVARPDESELQKKAQSVVESVAIELSKIPADVVLDCILLKEPSALEMATVCERIAWLVQDAAPAIHRIPELALVAVNQTPPGQAVVQDYGEPIRARIAITTFQVDAGNTRKSITVRIPFEDERAEGFITHEARQLPTDHPGLIMFDMTTAVSGMTAWMPLLARRLQPLQHTRVSAICMFTGNYMMTSRGFGWFPDAALLKNEHAHIPIPEWIANRLEAVKLPKTDHG